MTQSEQLLQRAIQVIPGGVNSPVRAFNAVGGKPIFMHRGKGACLFDVDGNRYVDYVGAFGPAIVGHCHPLVRAAVVSAAADGLGFGASTELEVLLAERLCAMLPSLELVRMVNSGTEATMSAIRLARGYTGRDKLIKFSGCYHGHSDSLLVNAGSGAMTLGVPSSPGVPAALAERTLSLTYNHLDEVRGAFESQGDQIACVIVEPIAGNMNCVLPEPGFLQGLRELCDRHGAVLIFDEVMTGFRIGARGAQGLLDVTPDLTTLGKVIGGGLPVGAFGGRREIMEQIAPLGPVYQAGTLSGSPLAMAAGLATLELTEEPEFYARLADHTTRLCDGVQEIAREAGVPFTTNRIGGMFGWFFSDTEVRTLADVERSELSRFAPFFTAMLQDGVFLAPSPFEAGFLSSAHDEATLEQTLNAARAAMRTL